MSAEQSSQNQKKIKITLKKKPPGAGKPAKPVARRPGVTAKQTKPGGRPGSYQSGRPDERGGRDFNRGGGRSGSFQGRGSDSRPEGRGDSRPGERRDGGRDNRDFNRGGPRSGSFQGRGSDSRSGGRPDSRPDSRRDHRPGERRDGRDSRDGRDNRDFNRGGGHSGSFQGRRPEHRSDNRRDYRPGERRDGRDSRDGRDNRDFNRSSGRSGSFQGNRSDSSRGNGPGGRSEGRRDFRPGERPGERDFNRPSNFVPREPEVEPDYPEGPGRLYGDGFYQHETYRSKKKGKVNLSKTDSLGLLKNSLKRGAASERSTETGGKGHGISGLGEIANPEGIRINRYLANSGYGSRREVEQYILGGRVKLNDVVIKTLDTRVKPGDLVLFDDNLVSLPDKPLYYIFNKPAGYIVSRKGFGDDPTIYDLLPEELKTLKYAGRLDKNSRGLLILSNDGAFIQAVSHPGRRLAKHYIVKASPLPPEYELQENFIRGVEDEGELLRAMRVNVLDREKGLVEIVLMQGKNRQIRRMFKAMGSRVLDLYRDCVGQIDLAKTPLEEGKLLPIEPEWVFYGQEHSRPSFNPWHASGK